MLITTGSKEVKRITTNLAGFINFYALLPQITRVSNSLFIYLFIQLSC